MNSVCDNLIKTFGLLELKESKKGVGSFLTFDFYANPDAHETSDAHMWVYLCEWNLFKGNELVLCSHDDSEDKYATVLEKMNGALLKDIKEQVLNKELRIKFDNGYWLQLTADLENYDSDDDLIIIYLKGKAISYSASKGFYEESSS